ncbi:MAG: hypothetical protein HOC20_10145 [Chloroflexi bacterium]|jgi:DNA-binding transcriptional regulator LsrR (DeoR family)|nr:hypothetical protein [Chloroflexota bacterium]
MARRIGQLTDQLDLWRCVWDRYTKPDVTQKEIAISLGMSEAKVSRLLERAVKEGMMKINVEVTPPRSPELEAALRDRFELFDAVVIPSMGDKGRDARRSVGIAASRYFEWLVKEGSKIAVASGTTLTQMVDNLTPRRFRDIRLYPMAVMELGLKDNAAKVVEFFPNALVAAMRAKYGGDVQAFNFQVSPVEKQELEEHEKLDILEQNGIKDLFLEALDADTFLVEIGTFKYIDKRAEAILHYYNTDTGNLKRISQGQINFQAFDSEHVLIEEFRGLNDIITISLEHLKQMSKSPGKHVIAVSAGNDAVEATIASLSPNIRCYDILITDASVAQQILSYD